MNHWFYTDEIKAATRKRRRLEAKRVVREARNGLGNHSVAGTFMTAKADASPGNDVET